MLRFPILLLSCVVPFARGAASQQPPSVVVKVYDQWLTAYRAGQYELIPPASKDGKPTVDKDVGKESLLASNGMLKGVLGRVTRKRELELLVDRAVEENSAATAQRVLVTAAMGLDGGNYPVTRAPHVVREVGERGLIRFTSPEAKDVVLQAAKEPKSADGKDVALGLQAAALRALGAFNEPTFRPILEAQLAAPDERLRVAAADGLARMCMPASIETLSRTLEREAKDEPLSAQVDALAKIFDKHEKEISPQDARTAMRAAGQALGHGSWRSDVALIDFLVRFRSSEVIPPLIAVLERFAERLEDVKTGKLSLMLRARAQNALVALTGAFNPADKPQEWRAFWEKNKEGFKVAAQKDPGADKSGTVTKGFFGIPVEGSRIVFVLDVSGSMGFPFPPPKGPNTTKAAGEPTRSYTRIDALKDNLVETIAALPEETKFALVMFSNGTSTWPKKEEKDKIELVTADTKTKKACIEFVKQLKPEAGTNFWAGIKRGLEIKSLVYGQRYESNIDELFVLSDGLPSVGEIIDPDEIATLVTETNRTSRVRINTIFLGSEGAQADGGRDGGPFMKKLAEQNHGKFVRKADK